MFRAWMFTGEFRWGLVSASIPIRRVPATKIGKMRADISIIRFFLISGCFSEDPISFIVLWELIASWDIT